MHNSWDDIRKKELSREEVYNRATWRRVYRQTYTPNKSRTKMKGKKNWFTDSQSLKICELKHYLGP